jgi:hypothetical protein
MAGAMLGLALIAPKIARAKPFYAGLGACAGITCAAGIAVLAIIWLGTRQREGRPSAVHFSVATAAQLGIFYVRRYVQEVLRAYLSWIAILSLCISGSAAFLTVRFLLPGRIPDSAAETSVTVIQILAALIATTPLYPSGIMRMTGLIAFLLLVKGLSGARTRMRETPLSYTDLQVRKMLNPEGARSEEERQFLDWLGKNHRRIKVASPDTDSEVE